MQTPTAPQEPRTIMDSPALAAALEAALAKRTKLHLHVTAAALQLVAAWLAEQARTLAEEARAHGSPIGAEFQTAISHRSQRTLHIAETISLQRLTPRELEVAAGIARGLSNAHIADELVIAVSTTERHVANILNKLGMRSRAQIAVWAAERGLAERAA